LTDSRKIHIKDPVKNINPAFFNLESYFDKWAKSNKIVDETGWGEALIV